MSEFFTKLKVMLKENVKTFVFLGLAFFTVFFLLGAKTVKADTLELVFYDDFEVYQPGSISSQTYIYLPDETFGSMSVIDSDSYAGNKSLYSGSYTHGNYIEKIDIDENIDTGHFKVSWYAKLGGTSYPHFTVAARSGYGEVVKLRTGRSGSGDYFMYTGDIEFFPTDYTYGLWNYYFIEWKTEPTGRVFRLGVNTWYSDWINFPAPDNYRLDNIFLTGAGVKFDNLKIEKYKAPMAKCGYADNRTILTGTFEETDLCDVGIPSTVIYDDIEKTYSWYCVGEWSSVRCIAYGPNYGGTVPETEYPIIPDDVFDDCNNPDYNVIEKMVCKLNNGIKAIFLPSPEKMTELTSSINKAKARFPFSYITAATDIISGINENISTDENTFSLSIMETEKSISADAIPLIGIIKIFTSSLVILAFMFWLIKYIKDIF